MMHSKFLTLILSFLLLSQSTPSSIFAAAGDLDALCNDLGKSQVSLAECFNFFHQDSRSSTANFTVLASIAVDVVFQNAGKMQSLIDTSLKTELNSTLRGVLDACSKDFSSGMFLLVKARSAAFFKDYGFAGLTLRSYTLAAAKQCMDEMHYKYAVIPQVRDGSASFVNVSTVAQVALSVAEKM